MMTRSRWPILAGMIFSIPGVLFSQGYVQFSNNPLQPVRIICNGWLPATPADDLTVGLYWSYDVDGEYTLATKTSGESALAPIVAAGVFNNGGLPVGIVGTNPGDEVFIVIKAWSGGFSNVEDAYRSGYPPTIIGESAPTSAIRLAALGAPAPNLVNQGGLRGFGVGPLTCVPEPSAITPGLLGCLTGLVLLRKSSRLRPSFIKR